MCCVRVGHVAEGVAARRHIHDTSERTRAIPVVNRSNNAVFYIRPTAFGAVGVFIILCMLGLQTQVVSNLIRHTD